MCRLGVPFLTITPGFCSYDGGTHLKRALQRAVSWPFQFIIVVGALLTLFIVLTPQGRAGFHTALFLTQVLEAPVKPQQWFTKEPLRESVFYPSPNGTSVAEVYRPPDGEPRTAALLSLGVYDPGFDGQEVVNLGYALARAGYVVMYQWSPFMGLEYRIDAAALDDLVAAFLYLEEQDYVDTERVGLGGFCVGASFALVAAADERIAARVHFVNAFGPYFDMEDLILQASSRSVVYDGERTPWQPHELTLRVLTNELVDTLEDPEERGLLAWQDAASRQSSTIDSSGLSQEGVRVSTLLEGSTPEEATSLMSEMPAEFREELARISPSAHIAGVNARLLVMHDRDDELVPAAESRRLLQAVEERGNVRYTELLDFDHVKPTGGGLLTIMGQAARLYRHMYEIIRLAH